VTARRGWATGTLVGATLLFLFVPLAVVVLFSFHSTSSLTLPFEGFSTRWYDQVFNDDTFTEALRNSLILGVSSAAVTLVLGTLAAYGISRSTSRLRLPLLALFVIPITLPGLFIGIALLSFFQRIELSLSLMTVLIGHVVFAFPFFFILARTALDRLDPALEEVARDLGATTPQVFRRVTLPQIWPILAGASALTFMLSLDEFLITFFVLGEGQTLPVYVFARLRRTVDPGINVVSTLLLAMTLIAWLLALAATLRAARTDRAPALGGTE
jgi:spermidine/putrescine transport system permease protein